MRSGLPALAAGLLAASLLAGCGNQAERRSITPLPTIPGDSATRADQPVQPTPKPNENPSRTPSRSPTPSVPVTPPSPATPDAPATPDGVAAGKAPPPWLGHRVLPTTASGYGEVRSTPPVLRQRRFTLPDTVRALPGDGFAARVTAPAPRAVVARSSWRPGCPVSPEELTWLRLTFWGFDDQRHTGELLVHDDVANDLVSVFERLYVARFPIEEMSIVTRRELDAPPTGDGNATTAFACRRTTGGTTYSQHAYGLAVDVNSFQNPYVSGDLVLPELASAYLDRAQDLPGMIEANGPVVRAFASIGWVWGGSWQSLKDYQHFSQNGG
ncbi:MAG TPA: M15 family metallopeptidase [Nocardioides sp.]|nr:M15 family metallopeptidase [Nocardioides sp.]